MYIFHTDTELKKYLHDCRVAGYSIGFIPTMGALHDGHISLINLANQAHTITVCSIFVNPTQFNNADDLAKYPRTTEQDIDLLTRAQCHVLYLPSVADVYPHGTTLSEAYPLGYLDTVLEGAYRPGHFQGVAQVVDRFLEIVQPDTLYLGRKDYQQCMVLKTLTQLKHPNTKVVLSPTLREPDGLAMSSRNRRLTEPQRALAAIIYQCLVSIQSKQGEGNFEVVKKECGDLMQKKGFQIDYIELADAHTLEILPNYDPNRKMVALIAAYIGQVRLIDNMEL
jgi:pantoate--beta-alanine ligase